MCQKPQTDHPLDIVRLVIGLIFLLTCAVLARAFITGDFSKSFTDILAIILANLGAMVIILIGFKIARLVPEP